MKFDKESWLKEYAEFVELNTASASDHIFKNINNRLFPNPLKVFGKIVAIHTVIGFLSLAICNQFNLNPFGTSVSLMDWFMRVGGHSFCMVACGVFFMTTTYLLANVFMNLEELDAIRRYQWLQSGVLGLISLFAFYFFGAELVVTFALLWFAGAILGALIAIEGSYHMRRKFA